MLPKPLNPRALETRGLTASEERQCAIIRCTKYRKCVRATARGYVSGITIVPPGEHGGHARAGGLTSRSPAGRDIGLS